MRWQPEWSESSVFIDKHRSIVDRKWADLLPICLTMVSKFVTVESTLTVPIVLTVITVLTQ